MDLTESVKEFVMTGVLYFVVWAVLLSFAFASVYTFLPDSEEEPNVGVRMYVEGDSKEVLFEEETHFGSVDVNYVYILSDDIPYERFSSELVDSAEMISYSSERVDSFEYERFLMFEGEYSDNTRESAVRINVSGYKSGSFTVIAVLDSKEVVVKEYTFSI